MGDQIVQGTSMVGPDASGQGHKEEQVAKLIVTTEAIPRALYCSPIYRKREAQLAGRWARAALCFFLL